MQTVWGYKSVRPTYSEVGKKLFDDIVEQTRIEFKKEYSHALENYSTTELYASCRFNSNARLLWCLESNIEESEFLSNPKHYLFRVMLGACSADYWYTFEKVW